MREIKKGQKFKHFKGAVVEVLELAKDSETLESVVVYRHMDTDEVWVRPEEMFNSLVDTNKYPDVKQKYRFEEIK